MGAFDNLQFATYKPTYVGLPVEQFIKTASALNDRYEQASEGNDRIKSMLANTPVDATKKEQLNEIGDNINKDLKTYVDNGNWEDAPLAIKQTAQKNIIDNPIYKLITQDYQGRQTLLKDLDEGVKKGLANGGYSKQYADSIAKYELETIGNGPVVINADGSASGVFKPVTPPREVDTINEPLKIAKEIIDSTNISKLEKYPGLAGYLYQDTYTSKDPTKILNAVKTWFNNNPDAKSYLDFKTTVDYHNTHYNATTKQYIAPTPEELEKLGYTIVKSAYQGADKDGNMIELQPGDITVTLPPVQSLDKNGDATGKYFTPYSDPIATINDQNLDRLWKIGYENALVQAPTSTILSMLSGQKIDRKVIKDERYWVDDARAYKKEQDDISRNGALGVAIPSNIPNMVPTSYTDIRTQNDGITKNLPTIMANSIAAVSKDDMTDEEKAFLTGYLTNRGLSASDIMKSMKWKNPMIVADLIAQREQMYGKLDYNNMINNEAMKVAGLTDAGIQQETGKYREEARHQLIDMYESTHSTTSVDMAHPWDRTFNHYDSKYTYQPSEESILAQAMKIAGSSKFKIYQDYIGALKKQAGTINSTNIFGMTKDELSSLNADLIPLVNANMAKGGMAGLYDASTLIQIEDKDKTTGAPKTKLDPGSITIDKINDPRFPGVSIIARQLNDKGEQGKYVVLAGITGLDAILAKHPGIGKLLQYKELINNINAMPGAVIPLTNTKYSITKNMPYVNPQTKEIQPEIPTGYTLRGPDVNGNMLNIPVIYNMDDLVKGLDRIYK